MLQAPAPRTLGFRRALGSPDDAACVAGARRTQGANGPVSPRRGLRAPIRRAQNMNVCGRRRPRCQPDRRARQTQRIRAPNSAAHHRLQYWRPGVRAFATLRRIGTGRRLKPLTRIQTDSQPNCSRSVGRTNSPARAQPSGRASQPQRAGTRRISQSSSWERPLLVPKNAFSSRPKAALSTSVKVFRFHAGRHAAELSLSTSFGAEERAFTL